MICRYHGMRGIHRGIHRIYTYVERMCCRGISLSYLTYLMFNCYLSESIESSSGWSGSYKLSTTLAYY